MPELKTAVRTNEGTDISPLMNTYNRWPISIVKGKGSYVWDDEGTKYLDFTSGIAVCNLGHAPEEVKKEVSVQLDKLWHCSNLYKIPIQEKLAKVLTENSFADRVFFCNSGAEANEAAIKLARKYAHEVKKAEKVEIVTFEQSFHGRTMASLSATGQPKLHEGFEPLVEGFHYLPYNDLDSLKEIDFLSPCAVMLELVQGEGGVVPADKEWVKQLAAICKENNILIMVDEVQTGIGRTGTLFAYEQYEIQPDVITLAKGLGSGFPIGAVLAKEEAAKVFGPGSHGSTFGGNPIASSAGYATVSHILNENILFTARSISAQLTESLNGLKEKYPVIEEVRGKGLLLGLLIPGKAADIITAARKEKVLILPAGQDVVRILPPLTATKEEIETFITILDSVFEKLYTVS
ncbi:acetylornithine transaminase [Pseudalkalibacillus caeni]|uniref:Acetylornithine aminotransferase n=1 Tax=Exobacillus caeni TaxID=2574798 RepID=A0A5R9F2Z6_9BACL|nr:acetylornithine transaminase [Pseudalkalibacillus caeni]TLS36860.1 acetylornithine transaminase [Pseudalkalibacillus caeni]